MGQLTGKVAIIKIGSGLLRTIYPRQAAYPHLKERVGSVINMGLRSGIDGGQVNVML
jgi:hypothetical protein